MYIIKYENKGISLYKDDEWILSNNGSVSEIVATRDAVEIMLKEFNAEYSIEY